MNFRAVLALLLRQSSPMVLIHTEIKLVTMVNMLNVSTGWTKLVRNLELVKFSLKINKKVRRRKKNKERIERRKYKRSSLYDRKAYRCKIVRPLIQVSRPQKSELGL